jgi:hypothetical protein
MLGEENVESDHEEEPEEHEECDVPECSDLSIRIGQQDHADYKT